MRRPDTTEYDPFYSTYVDQVPDGPVLEILRSAPAALAEVLAPVPPKLETSAYAPGKWSIRDVVAHVIDTERLFAYRALHFARRDPAPLPGMDQEAWATAAGPCGRPLAELVAEFSKLRGASTALFASFDEATLDRRGVASGLEFTVRASIYIVAGHELHHRDVLRRLYLAATVPAQGGPS